MREVDRERVDLREVDRERVDLREVGMMCSPG